MDSIDVTQRVKAYRFIVYSTVGFSVLAVLSICLTLPMLYNYINEIKKSIDTEIEFCQVRYFAHVLTLFCLLIGIS